MFELKILKPYLLMRIRVFLLFISVFFLLSCNKSIYDLNTVRIDKQGGEITVPDEQVACNEVDTLVIKLNLIKGESKINNTIVSFIKSKPLIRYFSGALESTSDLRSFKSVAVYHVKQSPTEQKRRRRLSFNLHEFLTLLAIYTGAILLAVAVYIWVDQIVAAVMLGAILWFGLYTMKIL